MSSLVNFSTGVHLGRRRAAAVAVLNIPGLATDTAGTPSCNFPGKSPAGRQCRTVEITKRFILQLRVGRRLVETAAAFGTKSPARLFGPLVQFDICSPRVGDERQREVDTWDLEEGPVELDAGPSSCLVKASRFFTSKPMWSRIRPLVPTIGWSVLENDRFAPGMSSDTFCPRIPGLAPNYFAYQAWICGIAASGTK
jgi:hypothetical protein